MKIIIIGAPGCGKGTQSKLLASRLNLTHISTGDLLRQQIEKGTELGMSVRDLIANGYLVPNNIVISILESHLGELRSNEGFILDGFPRTIMQAKYINNYSEGEKIILNIVIYLHLDDETIYKRNLGRRFCVKCQRDYNMFFDPPKQGELCDICGNKLAQRNDSLEKAISIRISEYKTKTLPVIEYYKRKSLLFKVDGSKTKEEIHEIIVGSL